MEIIGLIPAGGQATRLGKIPCSKEIFPLMKNKPANEDEAGIKVISEYLINSYRIAGINNIYFILRRGKWDIPSYYGDGKDFDKRCEKSFIVEQLVDGLGNSAMPGFVQKVVYTPFEGGGCIVAEIIAVALVNGIQQQFSFQFLYLRFVLDDKDGFVGHPVLCAATRVDHINSITLGLSAPAAAAVIIVAHANRDRGGPHGPTPPTPPCVRVRTRRFDPVERQPEPSGVECQVNRRRRWSGRSTGPGCG